MSNSDNSTGLLKDGFEFITKGDYSKAISEFEIAMLKSKKVDDKFKAQINIGICLCELQKEIEARKRLTDSLKQEGDPYTTGLAHFYLKNYLKSIFYFCLSNNRLKYIKIGQSYLEFSDLLDRLVQYKKQDESKKTDLYESILNELREQLKDIECEFCLEWSDLTIFFNEIQKNLSISKRVKVPIEDSQEQIKSKSEFIKKNSIIDSNLDNLISEIEIINQVCGCGIPYFHLLESIKGIISELESKRFDSFDKSFEDLILETHGLGI